MMPSGKSSLSGYVYRNFPFDSIVLKGNDVPDFLHRISTNDFEHFTPGNVRKTLLISEKAKILDAVWVFNSGNGIEMICGGGMSESVSTWLNKFIIMEDIQTSIVTGRTVDLYFEEQSSIDYFGIPARFAFNTVPDPSYKILPDQEYELYRISHGIPASQKELTQEYNPLELNLWDFISFTKGCYIGQEVIARLDTYNKVQRALCQFSSDGLLNEHSIVIDRENNEIGKVTSVARTFDRRTVGLAVLKMKSIADSRTFHIKDTASDITVENIFQKGSNG
jgi:folate-binding protein YgfZ